MRPIHDQSGVTLLELLVAIALTSIVGLALYRVFETQNRLYAGENKVVEMQGRARNAVNTLSRFIRMAGYDPQEAGVTTFGLTDASFGAGATAAITATDTVYFTADLNESGTLDQAAEYFAFRLNGAALERAEITDAAGTISGWSVVADHINALEFSYEYKDGSLSGGVGLPSNAATGRNFGDVRLVSISLTAQTATIHNLTGSVATETVSTKVKIRNNTELRL